MDNFQLILFFIYILSIIITGYFVIKEIRKEGADLEDLLHALSGTFIPFLNTFITFRIIVNSINWNKQIIKPRK